MSGETMARPGPAARERFIFLDALRGIAALAVVELHAAKAFEMPSYLYVKGALMVDFFFCLSGFVLAYAHSEQLRSGSLRFLRFMQLRYVRIWPMLALGTLLGAAMTLAFSPELTPSHANVPIASLLSLICLPMLEGGKFLWLNGVFWSLLAELIVNAFLAAGIFRVRNFALGALIVACAAAFAATTYMGFAHRMADAADILPTVARASASFFAGILVYRLYANGTRPRAPWWSLILLLVIVMFLPIKGSPLLAAFVMVALVMLVFPFIVLAGASCVPPFEVWAERLGRASFPLYALHYPVVVLAANLALPLPLAARIAAMAATILGSLVFALVAADYYETPFRRYLRRKLITRG